MNKCKMINKRVNVLVAERKDLMCHGCAYAKICTIKHQVENRDK